ncbi:MAG: aminotransferase class V-fold PLP-dependent enzyme [Myxococcales bacterium]|nr:aminotransferase class V-fold PLP-dependent enzyme [Myxococcales bacterium]
MPRQGSLLDLDRETRTALWRRVAELLEAHQTRLSEDAEAAIAPVSSTISLDRLLDGAPREPGAAVDEVARALELGIVHPDHPRYFGLFNPAPAALAVVADALVSGFNPQLATRGHAPWPVAVEDGLIDAFGARFGWAPGSTRGAFTSGGGEANMTAVACALVAAFPELGERGARALAGDPCLYVSAEGHATVTRAARLAGLGARAVRLIPADARQRMKPDALREAIAQDRAGGALPFLVVATAGTTGSGAIDPIGEIAAIAAREGCWLHVDAAWGGLAALVPELRGALEGIARADSITFDAHKILSVPIGTGAFLTRRDGVLEGVFADRTGYMPRDGASDPYARSMQWSRRFLGLRVLLPLLAIGWDGYAESLRRQVALAERLRERLRERAWEIVNDTPLPIVCFVDGARRADGRFLDAVARATIASAGGWLSVPRFANGARALRACVNNHRSEAVDIDRLVSSLDAARTGAA